MMKKSLIALAVMAASGAAFAATSNVDISGGLTVYLKDSNAASTDWAPSYNGALSLKGTEDLGGGMSAIYEVSFDLDNLNTASSANQMKDMKIGIKSSLGTVVAGRMEYLVEGVASARFDDLLTDADGHNAVGEGAESTQTAFGRANAIAYISPDWNGFHFAVAGNLDGATSGLTQHTDMLAVYNNGPLSVMLGKTDLDAASGDVTSAVVGYEIAGVKATVGQFTVDNGASADTSDTIVRLDYSTGPFDLSVFNKSSDIANADTTVYKATYNLSKRTSAYIGFRANEGTTADQTVIGMGHKF